MTGFCGKHTYVPHSSSLATSEPPQSPLCMTFINSLCRYIDDVTAEVEAHLDPASGIDKSWRRNASLAWIKLSLEKISPFSNSDATTFSAEQQPQDMAADFGRVSTVIKYLQQYGDASTAYNDLRPFVELLNVRERKQLITALDKNSIYGKVGRPKDEDSKSEGGSSPLNRHVRLYFSNRSFNMGVHQNLSLVYFPAN